MFYNGNDIQQQINRFWEQHDDLYADKNYSQ